MDTEKILEELKAIFIHELDNPDIVLTKDDSPKTVDGWDSLTHIQLIIAIEKFYKLRFTSAEIQKWKNVGDICDNIVLKRNKH